MNVTFANSFTEGLARAKTVLPSNAGHMPTPFTPVPVADLVHVDPPPPSYWWDGYLPTGALTLFGAHGGTGKSFVALMLGVCIAMGLPLFGVPTRRGTVCYFSGEDSANVLRHRLKWICMALDVSPADLEGRLHILDATAGEPVLFHEHSDGGQRRGATTPSYAVLEAYIEDHGIDVLVVDNASDTIDANENDRARVRAFVRALVQLVKDRAGAVMLLAHVDKATARSAASGSDSYSGSTAWHNSARSRLYLSRDKDGALLLEHQKATFGAMREPLRLMWSDGGVPRVDAPAGGIVQAIAERNQVKTLLKLIHEFTERGESVSTATSGPATPAQLFKHEASVNRRLRTELPRLLRDADRRGLIAREGYRNKQRKEKERWVLTRA